MGEVKTAMLIGAWKRLIPTFLEVLEGFETSVEEVAADGVEKARELELDVEPEDGIRTLEKTQSNEDLCLVDEQRRWCLEMGSAPGEDAGRVLT